MSGRNLVIAFAALVLVICTACQGGGKLAPPTGTAPPTPTSGPIASLDDLPAPAEIRITAAANSRLLNNDSLFERGGLITEDGKIYHTGANDLSYLIYELGPFIGTEQPSLATVNLDVSSIAPDVYIGLADFARNAWHWHGTSFADNGSIVAILDEGNYLEPTNHRALMIIAFYGAGTVDTNLIGGFLFNGTADIHMGSVTLTDNESLQDIADCNVIIGNLITLGGFTDYDALSSLSVITGDIQMEQIPVSSIVLPTSLEYVSGMITVYRADSLIEFQAPCIEFAGGVTIVDTPLLTSVSIPNLCECAGTSISRESIYFRDCPQLADLEFPSLYRTTEKVEFYANSQDYPTTGSGTLSFPELDGCQNIEISFTNEFSRIEFPKITELEELTLRGNSITEIELPNLTTLTSLYLGLENLTSFAVFPQLNHFKKYGEMTIYDCPALIDLSTPQTITFDHQFSTLEINSCSSLESLNGLEWITGDIRQLTLYDNPQLDDISALSGITGLRHIPLHVSSDASMYSNSAVSQSAPPFYALTIQDNPLLTSLNSLTLHTCDGCMLIAHNDNLDSLFGSFTADSVDNLDISNNTSLPNLVGLESLQHVRNLHVINNLNLTSLQGLHNLESCLGLMVYNNQGLLDLDALANLISPLQSIHIGENASLQSISGLNNLQPNTFNGLVIYYGVTIENNPALTGGDQAGWDLIDAWGGSSMVGGEIRISGNAPSS